MLVGSLVKHKGVYGYGIIIEYRIGLSVTVHWDNGRVNTYDMFDISCLEVVCK